MFTIILHTLRVNAYLDNSTQKGIVNMTFPDYCFGWKETFNLSVFSFSSTIIYPHCSLC